MTNRSLLLDRVRETLARAGYAVSERCAIRPVSFDVVARRDNHLLIVKVLTNIDAFDRRVAQEMLVLARFLKGSAVLVGERSGAGPLEDGVVYVHHGVRGITLGTLGQQILENEHPYVFAAPGGLYVRIERTTLHRLRVERRITLGTLADTAGVSRRTIAMYEQGMRATLEAALKLEEFLQTPLLEPINPLQAAPDGPAEEGRKEEEGALQDASLGLLEQQVFRLLETVGFHVVPTGKSPFTALSRTDDNLILTGINEEDRAARRKARIMASVSEVTERRGVFVVRKETVRTELEGTPVVSRKELAALREPEDLQRMIEDRRKRSATD